MTVEEWKRKNPPIQRKPISNADRIRSMSDEELAEFIWDYNFMHHEKPQELIEWLRQDVDDEVV